MVRVDEDVVEVRLALLFLDVLFGLAAWAFFSAVLDFLLEPNTTEKPSLVKFKKRISIYDLFASSRYLIFGKTQSIFHDIHTLTLEHYQQKNIIKSYDFM